jgi:hypothetical protein
VIYKEKKSHFNECGKQREDHKLIFTILNINIDQYLLLDCDRELHWTESTHWGLGLSNHKSNFQTTLSPKTLKN